MTGKKLYATKSGIVVCRKNLLIYFFDRLDCGSTPCRNDNPRSSRLHGLSRRPVDLIHLFDRAIVQSLFVFVFCFGFVLSIALPAFAKQKPRVALVLSGGGARGGAHIGVLRVFEREGIPIDLIVGASYGALVGGLYAARYSVDDLERIVVETDWWEITNNSHSRRLSNLNRKPIADRQMLALRLDKLNLKLPYGIFAGQKIQHFLNQLTIGATYRARNDFDRLPTPFRAIATDILSGEQVVIKNGSLGTAIRASISVRCIFAKAGHLFSNASKMGSSDIFT